MQGSTRIDELRQKFHENPRRYFAPLANEYRKAGDPEQAIAICRAHLAQQPGHMSGHVVYGQALYDAKRTEEARTVFEKALALDPDNAIVLKHLGNISRERGETAEARHWYSRAIDLDPSDREVAAYIAELTEPSSEAEAPAIDTGEAAATSAAEPDPVSAPESVTDSESGSGTAPIETTALDEAEASEPAYIADAEPMPVDEERSVSPIAAVEPESEPAPAEDDVAWRKTPPHEESPFVTRTMAELYASQGYRQAALDVYRQLALHHPDDKEIFDRIEALEREEKSQRRTPSRPAEPVADEVPAAVEASAEPEEPAASEPPAAPAPAPDLIPFEPMISDLPVESSDYVEVNETTAFAPSDEDLNLEIPADAGSAPHFTETELGGMGDSFDSDSWGAGFGTDEDLNLDFESPDIPAAAPADSQESPPIQATPSTAAVPESAFPEQVDVPGAPAEPEAELDQAGTEPAAEPVEDAGPSYGQPPEENVPVLDSPIAPMEPPQAEIAPEPAAEFPPEPAPEEEESAEDEAAESEPKEAEPVESAPVHSAAEEEFAEYEPEPEEASFVAYSPQLPEEEDLPHYAPKHPTVREFFATLGAFRPPARDASTITAHAAVAETLATPAASADDYPLASDAFANLFGDEPVSEEDNRAAFALSGAIGASTPPSNLAVSAPTEPEPAPPASTDTPAQESEEDIRRFREWLDGLAES
ncbi:MAG TPA: tetratricopeptide repeat protein [Gemmatimonadaceae bacterium]